MRPLLLLPLLLLAACATARGGAPGDPFERTNRQVLDLNLRVDDAVIRPVALGYRAALGPWPRARIRRAIDNLREPRFLANHLLQGRPRAAAETGLRFVINSTLGLGGLFDLAPIGGPPRQPADFGQTLHRWGAGEGPYLMLPIAGPSNPRDTVGMIADGLMSPLGWLAPAPVSLGVGLIDGIDTREQAVEALDSLRGESLDFYARLRSVWRQRRNTELGLTGATEPDVLDDPDAR